MTYKELIKRVPRTEGLFISTDDGKQYYCNENKQWIRVDNKLKRVPGNIIKMSIN